MGTVYADITLKNAIDVGNNQLGRINEQEVRQVNVRALVDTGAWTLVINEATREKLGVRIMKTKSGTLADGTRTSYTIAGPLEVIWKDRETNCDAVVLPSADDILLGAIPLEAMDLIVDPRNEQLVGAHGDEMVHLLK